MTDAGDAPRAAVVIGRCEVADAYDGGVFVADGGVWLRSDVARERAAERRAEKGKPPAPVMFLGVAAVFFVLGALFWGLSTAGR